MGCSWLECLSYAITMSMALKWTPCTRIHLRVWLDSAPSFLSTSRIIVAWGSPHAPDFIACSASYLAGRTTADAYGSVHLNSRPKYNRLTQAEYTASREICGLHPGATSVYGKVTVLRTPAVRRVNVGVRTIVSFVLYFPAPRAALVAYAADRGSALL